MDSKLRLAAQELVRLKAVKEKIEALEAQNTPQIKPMPGHYYKLCDDYNANKNKAWNALRQALQVSTPVERPVCPDLEAARIAFETMNFYTLEKCEASADVLRAFLYGDHEQPASTSEASGEQGRELPEARGLPLEVLREIQRWAYADEAFRLKNPGYYDPGVRGRLSSLLLSWKCALLQLAELAINAGLHEAADTPPNAAPTPVASPENPETSKSQGGNGE